MIIGLTAMALLPGASCVCHAQTVVKQEPMMMNRGTVVLVDDGSCPKGQIKQVMAKGATGSVDAPYGAVSRKCVRK